jgi:hypothetical protein
VANGGASVKMYHREYPDFRFQLHRQSDTLNAPMWNSLDILMEKGKASA